MTGRAGQYIEVDVPTQMLRLYATDGALIKEYRIATAKNGVGEQMGSECTPRGRHQIIAKIGAGAAPGTVFLGRRPTGEMYQPAMRAAAPERDWMLTRILWLKGLERSKNQGGTVDSMRRYIYIHGVPDENPMGVPGSRGCINMRNDEIIELFDLVEPYTPVTIIA